MNRDWGNELCDDSVDVFWFRICIHSGIRGQESGVMRCERHHMIVKEVSDYAGKNDGSPNLNRDIYLQWLPVMHMNLEPDPTVVNHEYKFEYDSFVC